MIRSITLYAGREGVGFGGRNEESWLLRPPHLLPPSLRLFRCFNTSALPCTLSFRRSWNWQLGENCFTRLSKECVHSPCVRPFRFASHPTHSTIVGRTSTRSRRRVTASVRSLRQLITATKQVLFIET